MAILQWDEWYETGILSIDHEHHNLFDALNRMHNAISSAPPLVAGEQVELESLRICRGRVMALAISSRFP